MKPRPEASTLVGKEESEETTGSTAYASKLKKRMNSVETLSNVGEGAAGEPDEDNDEKEAEVHLSVLAPLGDGDVCRALMERYARSPANQHRHLCATAAAMKSILSEEGLPLTPPAYFAAAITAVRDVALTDREGAAALSSFLAVVLPLVPVESLPKAKAKDAALVIASFLRNPAGGLSTGTLRSMVKSLGLVTLRVDLDDWLAVEVPFETLLLFAVDKRPKVRRCAQSCLEMLLKNFHSSSVTKRASKVVHSLHRKYIVLVKKPYPAELTELVPNKTLSKPEQLESLHMLNFLNVILPYLSNKVKVKILLDACRLLGRHFSWTRHILRILETLLRHSDVNVFIAEAENLMSAIMSYVSTAEKNPTDTIISASFLLKDVLMKFKDAFPNEWITYLPLLFSSLIGYLGSDSTISKRVADILEELINFNIHPSLFSTPTGQSGNCESQAAAVASVCSVSVKMLEDCSFPTEHMLGILSFLFLKLGASSFFFMKEIVIRLSQFMLNDEEKPNMKHLEQCFGAAVIAMGPEKLLTLVSIAIDEEKGTCSNSWIIPILKKYVAGASLQFFMNNIVPLANSIMAACKKVKKESMRKSLRFCFHRLWDLLPAFCRYPIDFSEKFESLSTMFMGVLKEEPSLHEVIALGLQALIYSNREDSQHCVYDLRSLFPQNFDMEFIKFGYSKGTVSKNMKTLASRSIEFFQIFTDIFFESSEKRGCIKDALGSFGFIIPSEYLRNFFLSSFKIVEQSSYLVDPGTLDDHLQAENKNVGDGNEALEKSEKRRCLLMELASSFIGAADMELTKIIFDFISSSLMATNEVCQCEAYLILSITLKEKELFSSAQLDELMELLFTVEPPNDTRSLKNRFSCFNYLLVYILKSNADDMHTKAFLILNEIIITLKSKESRKLAYDTLLTISGKLKASHSDRPDSDLFLLFNMVMGYLSSSSPQIMSGAVSALSLLIYHDAAFCLSVPNLIPSVLVLLQNKANEVIKATLGFIKVLVSSLICKDLMHLLPEILLGILPWSSVSKNHIKSKVVIILEILIRKCSSEAVEKQTPEKYKRFVKSINEGRKHRKMSKATDTSDSTKRSPASVMKRGSKRPRDITTSNAENEKIWKKRKDSFSNNKSSRKVMHKGLRNRSDDKGHSNSQRQNNARPRRLSTNRKRRFAEKQNKISSKVGSGTKIQKQSPNTAKEKKSIAASEAAKSSRFSKSRTRSR